MRREYQKGTELARNKAVDIGVDVHKESWQVTARAEGEEVFHGRLPSQYHALRRLFDRFPGCTIKVAYEAGPCGFWLYDRLTADGIETIVVPPSLIPVESGNRVKTDKETAESLPIYLSVICSKECTFSVKRIVQIGNKNPSSDSGTS